MLPTEPTMPRNDDALSHWHFSVEDFNTSTLDFFAAIETTLLGKLAPVRPDRIDYHESGVLSAKREYLRVSYGRYSFDIGAAPFGKDFFFSWWLVRRLPDTSLMTGCLGLVALPIALVIFVKAAGFFMGIFLFFIALGGFLVWAMKAASAGMELVEDAILALPVAGALYNRFLRPMTYYSEDSRKMFEETVHRVVLAHVGGLLSLAKLPHLSPEDMEIETLKPLI
jgi:hypothetical protein